LFVALHLILFLLLYHYYYNMYAAAVGVAGFMFCTTTLVLFLVFLQRESRLVKFRVPSLFFLQGILVSLDIVFRLMVVAFPFACWLSNLAIFSVYPMFCFPYLVRSWTYMFQFSVVQPRDAEKKSSWFLAQRWMIEPRFLIPFTIIAGVLQVVPPVIYGATTSTAGEPYVPRSLLIVDCVYSAFYVVLALLTSSWLRRSRDTWHIKDEFTVVVILWGVCTITKLATYAIAPNTHVAVRYVWNTSIVAAMFGSFCASDVWLLWLLFLESRPKRPTITVEQPVSFTALMEDKALRTSLLEFMMLQFCAENLLFWEAIEELHHTAGTLDRNRALEIYEKFIAIGAPLEINLTCDIRRPIIDAVSGTTTIPNTVYSEAFAEVEQMIILHAYPQFRMMYKKSNLPLFVVSATVPIT